MINIGLIESQSLLRDSFKLMLETHSTNKVVFSSNHYLHLQYVEESLDVVLLDLPNFLQYNQNEEHTALTDETKLIVVAQTGEESSVVQAIEAQAWGFLLKEMETEEFLYAVEQVAQNKYYIHGRASHYIMASSLKSVEKETQRLETSHRPVNPLPKRAFRALQLTAEGISNEEIAEEMQISEKTVKNHMSFVLASLQVRNRTAAVVKAIQNGWIVIPKAYD